MEDNKFILIGLDDSRSKDIAEVLGNKTCKKILDFLAETKEASEKDIADGLKIPINTAEYNLNKLVKSGLVEKSKNFFWSKKGRKIGMYKLARKHIIISPNKKPDINYVKSILPVLFAALVLVAAAGIFLFNENLTDNDVSENKVSVDKPPESYTASGGTTNFNIEDLNEKNRFTEIIKRILIFIIIILIIIVLSILQIKRLRD